MRRRIEVAAAGFDTFTVPHIVTRRIRVTELKSPFYRPGSIAVTDDRSVCIVKDQVEVAARVRVDVDIDRRRRRSGRDDNRIVYRLVINTGFSCTVLRVVVNIGDCRRIGDIAAERAADIDSESHRGFD